MHDLEYVGALGRQRHRTSDWRTFIKTLGAVMLDWRLGLIVAICPLLMLLLAQAPFSYSFRMGQLTGAFNDPPFTSDFNAPEGRGATGRWRWTQERSSVVVPGIGRRGVIVGLDIISHRAQWQPDGPPAVLHLRAGDLPAVPFTLRREGAHYQLYLPPHALRDGALRLEFATEPWQQPGDRRQLGVALGDFFTISGTRPSGPVLPDTTMLLGWSLGLALLWPALRVLGFRPREALLMLLPLAVVVPLLTLPEAPRLAVGSSWAVQVGVLCLVAAAICAWGVPRLLARLDVLPPPAILRWLLLLVVLSFAVKYGGRLYPESMPGDIGLHVNRYQATITGGVYIRAQHRGLPFPFPPALYLLLAPFTLTGLDIRTLFELTAGLFEASTVLLLYLLVTRVAGLPKVGLAAAAIYTCISAGFMNTWFAFETQVAAQWFALMLMAVLALGWPNYAGVLSGWVLLLLFAQVFLGHIGLFINVSILGLMLLPLLWWRSQSADERQGVGRLLVAGLAAGLFVALFYYSAFMGLILEQVQGVAREGLNGVTEREPIPRATSLQVLWEGGLITHFGFFPVVLAALGIVRLNRMPVRSIVPPLIWLTFFVSASQAVLPFITLSSITTRWLMFSAWAITVAGALGVWWFWRRGRAGRLLVAGMAAYVCWLTIVLCLDAMVWSKAPIEPF